MLAAGLLGGTSFCATASMLGGDYRSREDPAGLHYSLCKLVCHGNDAVAEVVCVPIDRRPLELGPRVARGSDRA